MCITFGKRQGDLLERVYILTYNQEHICRESWTETGRTYVISQSIFGFLATFPKCMDYAVQSERGDNKWRVSTDIYRADSEILRYTLWVWIKGRPILLIISYLLRHADHVAPSIRKSWQSLHRQNGGRSVGIVRSRTQTMEFFYLLSSTKSP
jgi:hypothetical protein